MIDHRVSRVHVEIAVLDHHIDRRPSKQDRIGQRAGRGHESAVLDPQIRDRCRNRDVHQEFIGRRGVAEVHPIHRAAVPVRRDRQPRRCPGGEVGHQPDVLNRHIRGIHRDRPGRGCGRKRRDQAPAAQAHDRHASHVAVHAVRGRQILRMPGQQVDHVPVARRTLPDRIVQRLERLRGTPAVAVPDVVRAVGRPAVDPPDAARDRQRLAHRRAAQLVKPICKGRHVSLPGTSARCPRRCRLRA